jgi:hypothetical protein
MGRKEGIENLKGVGKFMLEVALSPLFFFWVLLLSVITFLMLIFSPLLRLFFGPKDDAPLHREYTERAPQNPARAPAWSEVTSAPGVVARDDDPLDRWADDGGAPRP